MISVICKFQEFERKEDIIPVK